MLESSSSSVKLTDVYKLVVSVLEDILLELHAGFVDAMALRGHGLPLDGEVRGSGDVGGGDGQGVRLVKQNTVLQFVDQSKASCVHRFK